MKLCECECNQEVSQEGNRFIKQHHCKGKHLSYEHKQRIKNTFEEKKIIREIIREIDKKIKYCECGCGIKVNNRFVDRSQRMDGSSK